MTRPGAFAWFGASLVWCGAALLSFAGLNGLAVSCYISPTLAPVMPVVIDVGVAVAAWVWRRGVNPEASKLAGRMTWTLLFLTVLGNGSHLGMEASHVTPPWWAAALVGAVPPAVAGTVAHLLVLLGRASGSPDEVPEIMPGKIPPSSVLPVAPRLAGNPSPAPPNDLLTEEVKPKRVNMTAGSDKNSTKTPRRGTGRVALARKLGISEYEARKMLERQANNGVKVLEEAL